MSLCLKEGGWGAHCYRFLPWLLVPLFFLISGCDGKDHSVPQQTRYDSIHALMANQVQVQMVSKERVFDQPAMGYDPRYYPSEAAISFWSAYKIYGDVVFRSAAERQCNYARSMMATDGLFTPVPFRLVSRLSQARLIIGFFVAYEASGDPKYLSWADEAADGFLKLQVESVKYKADVFQLFNYAYDPNPPYLPQSTVRMNPNQESAIGLAFTLLYFTEKSRFFHDARLFSLAWQNLNAALVLQDPKGRIPTDEDNLEAFDTLYGSYTLLNLAWANKYWHSENLSSAVKKGAEWLSLYSDGSTDRFYPERYQGQVRDPVELWERLPVLAEAGMVTPQLQNALDNVMRRWPNFSSFPGGFVFPSTILINEMGLSKELILGVK